MKKSDSYSIIYMMIDALSIFGSSQKAVTTGFFEQVPLT